MKKVIIFGTGVAAIHVYYSIHSEKQEVIAFSDNDPDNRRMFQERYGFPVLEPDKIPGCGYDLILIAVMTPSSAQAIRKQLIGLIGEDKSQRIVAYADFAQADFRYDQRIAILKLLGEEICSRKLTGNVAELGVYKGEFAQYINQVFPDKKLYLFDTFSGFDFRDESSEARKIESEFSDTSIQEVMEKMKYKEQCVIRKGYFPETAAGIDVPFCFVSLDADLYDPIYSGLRFFYPLLQEGGYIIVHDYNSPRFQGAGKAVKQFCREERISYVPICDWGMSAIIAK